MTEIVIPPAVEISADVSSLIDRMTVALSKRAETARDAGNEPLAKKWERENASLTKPTIATALHGIGFDAAKLEKLAIYAAQKVRRIAGASAGEGRIDPFTIEIIRNARTHDGALSGRAVRGALSTKVALPEGMTLSSRRISSEGTASSQAGSSRQALAAMGLATVKREGRDSVVSIEFDHPMLAAVV